MELRVLSLIFRRPPTALVAHGLVALGCASHVEQPPVHAAASPPAIVGAAPSKPSAAPAHAAGAASAPPEEPERAAGGASPASAIDPSVAATNASLPEESGKGEEPHAELPRGTTVLHIGDSFAGALGIDLNRELKAVGVRGILKYETATYIPTWASGKDLEKYLSKYHPDLVMITLGANELEIPDPAQRVPTIRRLVARLSGRPCVWVAPPLWRGARPALLDVIRESCAPCVYLDSSAIVPDLPRMRDGIHPAMAARKTWAKAVVEWLAQHRRGGGETAWTIE